jgi:dTDP-4-dehydrorhamnose 3,5-epimerase
MKFFEQKIKGVMLIEAEPFIDDRGAFRRNFCINEFNDAGIDSIVKQANISENKFACTLRGFHYQLEPYQEAKTISCLDGRIYDIVVDLRPDSPTFLKWVSFEIGGSDRKSIHIPKGCANAFLSLEDNTLLHYYSSEFYAPEYERGIRYNDPVFGFEWPEKIKHTSEKDNNHPYSLSK